MRDNIAAIYKVFTNDETLLRLLYYKPVDANDNPLDPLKQDILTMDAITKANIINDLIKTTPTVTDLSNTEKCRILFYPGRRTSTNNYLIAKQEIVFDILVHFDFDNVDLRLSWITDRLNELVCNQKITGLGKVYFVAGGSIGAPPNYVGYRVTFSFGSVENGA